MTIQRRNIAKMCLHIFFTVWFSSCFRSIAYVESFVPIVHHPTMRHLSTTKSSIISSDPATMGRTILAMSDDAADDDRPDPSILISAKDDTTQQLVFASAFALLAVGTNVCIQLWNGPGELLCEAMLGAGGYETIRGTIFPIAFGSIFAIVGVLHFVFVENFARIVPPKGTWGGLWQVPAPFQEKLGISYEYYHSYLSGVAEIVGGLWLLAGGLGFTSVELPAFLLFLLTIAVYAANLYMFTHDKDPGEAVPRLSYPAGHIARFVLQCGLLSNFWIVANP